MGSYADTIRRAVIQRSPSDEGSLSDPVVGGSEWNGLVRCRLVDGLDNERLYGPLL